MLITCKEAAELIEIKNHRELQDIAKSTPPHLPGAPIRLGSGNHADDICFANYRMKNNAFTYL